MSTKVDRPFIQLCYARARLLSANRDRSPRASPNVGYRQPPTLEAPTSPTAPSLGTRRSIRRAERRFPPLSSHRATCVRRRPGPTSATLNARSQPRQRLRTPKLPHGSNRFKLAAPRPHLARLPLVYGLPRDAQELAEVGGREAETLSMARQTGGSESQRRFLPRTFRHAGSSGRLLHALRHRLDRPLQCGDIPPERRQVRTMLRGSLLE